MNTTHDVVWLQITAGQGPKECGWVVAQIYKKILQDPASESIQVRRVESLAFDKVERNQNEFISDAYSSILLRIEGDRAHNLANQWNGTIKWHGQSHYRPKHKRNNWFVGVKMIEVIESNPIEIKNLEREINIEAMRASGPGGQHVNKTNSAVRITHVPTGIKIKVESERSQHRNKQIAIERLHLLLQSGHENERQQIEYDRWLNHYQVERGKAVRSFSGSDFKEVFKHTRVKIT